MDTLQLFNASKYNAHILPQQQPKKMRVRHIHNERLLKYEITYPTCRKYSASATGVSAYDLNMKVTSTPFATAVSFHVRLPGNPQFSRSRPLLPIPVRPGSKHTDKCSILRATGNKPIRQCYSAVHTVRQDRVIPFTKYSKYRATTRVRNVWEG